MAASRVTPPIDARAHTPGWLEESWRDPLRLRHTLRTLLDGSARVAAKSHPEHGFDLYHDMVLRHLGAGSVALHGYDPYAPLEQRWWSISYEHLHVRCTELAAAWSARGVTPGSKLAIVLPFGPRCAIALLTGLRLGACVALLEPGGPQYLAPRLGALAPDFVASESFHGPALGTFADLLLSDEPVAAQPMQGSHSYRPGEPCAWLFSPLRRPPHVPVPLTCDDAFHGALRDGLLTFALRPGDRLAAPGFDTTQHQPALLFAALLQGACFVHIDLPSVLADPARLGALELRSVGVHAQVGEALLQSDVRRPPWAHVFRNPEEPSDWETWRDLVERLELADVPMSNAILEAASGGALLASPRRPARQHLAKLMHVSPAPGRPWRLLDFTGSGQRSVGDVGVFAPLCGPTPEDDDGAIEGSPYIVLARRRGLEYLYGGTTEPRRSGRVIPMDELLDALVDCPFLSGASLVALPAGGSTLAQRFVLLGFCGAEPRSRFSTLRGARAAELLRVLSERLDPALAPDRVELFPGFPRVRAGGTVDHDWCRTQYLTGTLVRKANQPVFERLTELRGALLEAALGGG